MTAIRMTDNRTLVEQLSRLDAGRLRAYRDNLAFYRGQQWQGAQRRRERRLVFNYAKALIDKTASYLMQGMQTVVDPEDGSPAAAQRARLAEQALRQVYEANNLEQLDFDSEIDASILGDGAYKVTWDADQRRVRVTTSGACGGWRVDMPCRTKRRDCCMGGKRTLARAPAEMRNISATGEALAGLLRASSTP